MIAIWMNKQSYKFCDLISTQDNFNGYKKPICKDNLIAHINLSRYFGEFVRPMHMDPYNLWLHEWKY